MYYVQAIYETRSGKQTAGPRHNLPGVREVFKRAMSRGEGCVLARRESNGFISREALNKLISRVELAISAARADLAAYNAEGPLEWKLAGEANAKLDNLRVCYGTLFEGISQCVIDDEILTRGGSDPDLRERVAARKPRTKRISRIRLALA